MCPWRHSNLHTAGCHFIPMIAQCLHKQASDTHTHTTQHSTAQQSHWRCSSQVPKFTMVSGKDQYQMQLSKNFLKVPAVHIQHAQSLFMPLAGHAQEKRWFSAKHTSVQEAGMRLQQALQPAMLTIELQVCASMHPCVCVCETQPDMQKICAAHSHLHRLRMYTPGDTARLFAQHARDPQIHLAIKQTDSQHVLVVQQLHGHQQAMWLSDLSGHICVGRHSPALTAWQQLHMGSFPLASKQPPGWPATCCTVNMCCNS